MHLLKVAHVQYTCDSPARLASWTRVNVDTFGIIMEIDRQGHLDTREVHPLLLAASRRQFDPSRWWSRLRSIVLGDFLLVP